MDQQLGAGHDATMPRETRTRSRKLRAALAFALGLVACDGRPTDAQLRQWRREATARNESATSRHGRTDADRAWELTVRTTIPGRPSLTRYSLDSLLATDATTIRTRSPFHRSDLRQLFDFRGTRIATLLDRAGITEPTTDVTFLAYDGYAVTLHADVFQNYPVILAQTRDGRPLARTDGGPLLIVFPYSSHPETAERYPELYWCFYVAEMIAGTPAAALRVGGRTFSAADLDALPRAAVDGPVRFRQHWPSGHVHLAGVRVRDLLVAAAVSLEPGSSVRVRTRVPVDRDPSHEHRLTAEQIRTTDVMIAYRWGDANEVIPARMGGPLTLVRPVPEGAAPDSVRWATFVDAIEVTSP